MWRRVSCEQPLDTSQSILRLRGSLNQKLGVFSNRETNEQPKGNVVHIPQPGRGTVIDLVKRGNTNRPGDAHRSSGKSCLFCISRRGPGILSQGERVLVLAKSAAVLAASTSGRWDLENPREITAESRQLVPISAAGLQGEQPLVDRIM